MLYSLDVLERVMPEADRYKNMVLIETHIFGSAADRQEWIETHAYPVVGDDEEEPQEPGQKWVVTQDQGKVMSYLWS